MNKRKTELHRHFYFWCPTCRSKLHLETAERAEDDGRGVDVGPWGHEPYCPMCGTRTQDWDEIAVRDDRFINHGEWVDFEKWHAEQPKQPAEKPWGEDP